MAVSSGKFNSFISGTPICIYPFNPRVGINENYKYFIAALIETIYFNSRLDFGVTSLNDMDEFVPVTKHMKGRKSKIQMHPVKKKWQLTVC